MDNRKNTDLEQCALVTGGAHGIGQAICQRLAKDGLRIAIADIDFDAAQDLATKLGPDHVALAVDLTDAEAAASLPTRAADALGVLNIIVNNAGVTDSSGQSLVALPKEAFDRLVALNLTAVERICAAAATLLQPGARIVNLASGASYLPLALRGPYSATKAGIVALTEGLADELSSRGICVSAVAPGYTRTPLVEELHRAGRVDLDKVAAGIPLRRLAMPEDIANAVAFAASAEGKVVTSQTLLVDGGFLAGTAPKGVSPARGTAPDGKIAVLASFDPASIGLEGDGIFHTDRAGLEEAGPLAAVIDVEALADGASPAELLARTRSTVLACAALPNRSPDFALLFASPEGAGAGEKAAVAARTMLARTVALEWAHSGLRVNAVIWKGSRHKELGGLCRFLVGTDATYITGQVIQAGRSNYRGPDAVDAHRWL